MSAPGEGPHLRIETGDPTTQSRPPLAAFRDLCLSAVIVVSSAVPWYTLRQFPLLQHGNATFNVLDGLVACTVALALPTIARAPRRNPAVWWVVAFVAYLAIPLAVGIRAPDARFFAIREARALSFYALAVVFVTARYPSEAFRRFVGLYVVAVTVGAIVAFAHVLAHLPLPGYLDLLVESARGAVPNPNVQYLELTTIVLAFPFALMLAATARGALPRAAWILCWMIVGFYILATGERFPQVLAAGALIVVVAILLPSRTARVRDVLAAGAVAALLFAGASVWTAARWPTAMTTAVAQRWSQILTDSSLSFRLQELQAGVPLFLAHPLVGEGLGGVVLPESPPPDTAMPWRYIASGYGFLAVKTGAIGLALYLAMVWFAAARAVRRLRRAEADSWPTATVGLVGLGVLLLFNLTRPVADIPEGAIAFSLCYAMCVGSDGD